ncbi:MAG: RNA polymerase sigma factor [Planctomycetes bacterium]|nr:RNA polymerase sigma factor [Planctomycetota bacterium]
MRNDDRQLLIRMHRGHEPSARLLWERYAASLAAFARAVVRDKQAAEDVVQSVMLRVLVLRREQVESVTDPLAWLAQLTRREAISQFRSMRRRERRNRLVSHLEPTPARGPEGVLNDVRSAMERLPRKQREVIALRHASGMTFDQIALALGQNRNTVAARYRAGVEAIRASVGGLPMAGNQAGVECDSPESRVKRCAAGLGSSSISRGVPLTIMPLGAVEYRHA